MILAPEPTPKKLVAKFGGGVNTWAMLVLLRRQEVVPDAIVMADPGSEWPATIAYRDGVGAEWLRSVGFPPVTVVSRASEAPYRLRRTVKKTETLLEECERLGTPPSMAYGLKRCSMVYKAEPSFWWLVRQPWARAEREAGRRVAMAVGYDAGEPRRWRDKPEWTSSAQERAWSFPCYPLAVEGIDRDGCKDLILSEGLPLPRTSACVFCPNNEAADWHDLAREDRPTFDRVVDVSRRSDDKIRELSVGFLRTAGKTDKRRLHLWVDGAYGDALPSPPGVGPAPARDEDEENDQVPCECAL